MATERLRQFATAAAAAAVSITRPNYFDTGKRGIDNSPITCLLMSLLN